MNSVIKAGLAVGLWLLVADAAMAQIVVSPDGKELLLTSDEDQKCFEALLRRVAEDDSSALREVEFSCEPQPLDGITPGRQPAGYAEYSPPAPPPAPPPSARLNRRLADCIRAILPPRRFPSFPLALLLSPCPSGGR